MKRIEEIHTRTLHPKESATEVPHVPDLMRIRKHIDNFLTLGLPHQRPDSIITRSEIAVFKTAVKKTNAFLRSILVEFGLPRAPVREALLGSDTYRWEHYRFNEKSPSPTYALANAERMFALEKREPGSVSYLYRARGIRNFARYSIEFWLRQYRERTSDLPSMLIISASDLEMETLSGTPVYTELQNDLRALNRPHLMRMIEVANIPELLRLLVRLNRTYNKKGKNPIPIVVLDSHGDSDRAVLSSEPSFSVFGKDQITDERFDRVFEEYLTDTFSSATQFIFGSCEAAQETAEFGDRSVAATLKEAMQRLLSKKVRVTAADNYVTQFTKLTPSIRKDGTLSIKTESVPYEEFGRNVKTRMRNL